MAFAIGTLLVWTGVGILVLVAVQSAILTAHLRRRDVPARPLPAVSILKPLCGLDDELKANLISFMEQDYPRYEMLLGVRSAADPAYPLARAIAGAFAGRVRVVVQQGEAGMNPKVNQLIGLARAARYPILVVSDSNVRVRQTYLRGIAARFEDPRVGLVTHLVAGTGEIRLGSIFDGLHLAGDIAPGIVAAQRLVSRDIVVGKSMALRRADLAALGGFEALKDVLAEDYLIGARVGSMLGKKVAIAAEPVENVTKTRGVLDFASRYQRWSVMQRRAAGTGAYVAMGLLNPVFVAAAGLILAPGWHSVEMFTVISAVKSALDGRAARSLRRHGYRLRELAVVPLKDVILGLIWTCCLFTDKVNWRGHRLRVLPGTLLERSPSPSSGARAAPLARTG